VEDVYISQFFCVAIALKDSGRARGQRYELGGIDFEDVVSSYHCDLLLLRNDEHIVCLGKADEAKYTPRIASQLHTAGSTIPVVDSS
jgi:hypothetical protein